MSWLRDWLTGPASTPVTVPAMVTVRVHCGNDDGGSDRIHVEGAIEATFKATGRDCLAFSDGTVLRVEYAGNSTWAIAVIHDGGSTALIQWCDPTGEDGDTDRATLTGPIEWVVVGSQMATVTR